MKKEELIALGIEEEVAKKIMSINGVDIENAKGKAGQATEKLQVELENSKLELKSKEEQLINVNSEIEKFKGMNIEEIKNQVETLKTQASEFEIKSKADKEAFEKQLADQQYDFKINEYVNGQKFTSEFTKKAYMAELKAQGFKLDKDGNLLGANEYTEKFKTENQGVLIIEEAPQEEEKVPQFTKQSNSQPIDSNGFNFGWTPPQNK